MTNKKELIGQITDKKLDRVKNKKSEYYNNPFYRLTVELENEGEREILVFKEWLEQEKIWEQIEQSEYIEKRFLFKIQRKPGAGQFFRLLDWKVLEIYSTK